MAFDDLKEVGGTNAECQAQGPSNVMPFPGLPSWIGDDRSMSLCKRWLCCDGVLHVLQVEQHHGKVAAHGHCHSGRVLCPAAATGKNIKIRAMLEDCWKNRKG